VTTLPAPTTDSSPMVTPGQTMTPPPTQAPNPIAIGAADSYPVRRAAGSRGWVAVSNWTIGPIWTSLPIVTAALSRNTAP
jgi:hypothetical protein